MNILQLGYMSPIFDRILVTRLKCRQMLSQSLSISNLLLVDREAVV